MCLVEIQARYAHFVHLMDVVDEAFRVNLGGGMRSEYRCVSGIDVGEIGVVDWIAKRVYVVDVL
jgi:hypothetical protein